MATALGPERHAVALRACSKGPSSSGASIFERLPNRSRRQPSRELDGADGDVPFPSFWGSP